MQQFFRFWMHLELQTYPAYQTVPELYVLTENGMVRRLLRHNLETEEEVADAISSYIRQFDRLLKQYFAGLQQQVPAEALQAALEQSYLQMQAGLS